MPFRLKPFLTVLLATWLIIGCQNNIIRQSTNSQLADCHTVKHIMGDVCVPPMSQRLVTLDEPTIGDVLTLGVQPIGTSLYDELADYLVKKSSNIEFLGDSDAPNLEKIYQLQPDLIVGIEFVVEPIFQQLSQIAPTAVGRWIGLPSWREHFNFVAHVLGKEEKAKAIWDSYNRRIEKLKAAMGDLQDLEISLAYTYDGEKITMDAENSFAGSILADLGLRQTKSQSKVNNGIIPLSEERISDIDADILFIGVFKEESEKILAKLQLKPLWNQLQVVQNKRVYLVDVSIWRGGNPMAANLVIDDLNKYLLDSNSNL